MLDIRDIEIAGIVYARTIRQHLVRERQHACGKLLGRQQPVEQVCRATLYGLPTGFETELAAWRA
jgi:hypothetical protein